MSLLLILPPSWLFPHIKITPFPFSSFLETNQNPTTKHPLCPSKLYPTLSALQTWSPWKRSEPLRDRPGRPQTVFTSLGSYLCLDAPLPLCVLLQLLWALLCNGCPFSLFKPVRNFWMQPSFGDKRKWFLLVRETNQGGGAAMSADTCPGLSTGPLLPGDSGWISG